jgi:uncharacterized membrane protein YphA (DoxX/SURF4 family)
MMTSAQRYHLMLIAVIVLGMVGYMLPWLTGSAAGLTFNANDLAEWSSLHPEVRISTPPLLTTALLRLPLACLVIVAGCAVVSHWQSPWWWVNAVLVSVSVTALLPPVDFLTHAQDSPNYRQQFALAIAALTGGILGLSGYLPRVRRILVIVASLVGITAGLIGWLHAYNLVRGFDLSIQIGSGIIILMLAYMLLIALTLRPGIKQGSSN